MGFFISSQYFALKTSNVKVLAKLPTDSALITG